MIKRIIIITFVAAVSSICLEAKEGTVAFDWEQRCEHLVSPLGIDAQSPRLSWRLPDGIRTVSYTHLTLPTNSLV